ncbi:nucleoside-diphosphate sugar epimerase/dehydratase [Sulfuricurvum sp.]|uniref:polysaccharide biosynthesis protein n=1 Tax=Sulfuricurvum sp. TaxID=2025608 RepID=UPI0025F6F2E7|nr:nucleoside-diphosphate sugar epimerase/dehydratase [Sulfuricurvum sp.]
MSELLQPSTSKRIGFFLLVDTLLGFCTLYTAYLLRFNFDITEEFLTPFWFIALTLLALKLLAFSLFQNYKIIWRFFALGEARELFKAHVAAYGAFTLLYLLFPDAFAPFPRSVIIIDFLLSFSALGGLRFSKRLILESGNHPAALKPALIIGVSSDTIRLVKRIMEGGTDYYPVAIVAVLEKNRHMVGSTIHNLNVIGTDELRHYSQMHTVSAAIIDGTLPQESLREIYTLLKETDIREIKRTRLLDSDNRIETLSIEDLLARHPQDLDIGSIQSFIQGKTLLITGGGGSIGSEISLQCHRFGAARVILIDHSEYNLYQIAEQLPSAILHLCSVTDFETLDRIMQESRPDIVIHAAAYKHVPLCEANVHAAIENNIQGSRNVIDSAISHNVAKIVIISTDKAVRPTNVMGATKRVVELYAQNVDPRNSEIVSVRFGNVLGSSGSVIPKFKSQIEQGGPLTITHPEITRYFMLISEACQLVLQAASIAKGGELFILNMGESVKIVDLAQTMIRLYATRPIEIEYTGLRPGEKLFEELLMDESEQKTTYESIMIAHPTRYPIETLKEEITLLRTGNTPIKTLQRIVPEFTPSASIR